MKKVCIYCGSRLPNDLEIINTAKQIGSALAEQGFGLVFGGGKVGIMGIIADSCLENNGHVIGVIPSAIKNMEVGNDTFSWVPGFWIPSTAIWETI